MAIKENDFYTRYDGSKCENKFMYIPIALHDRLYELKKSLEDNIRYILGGQCATLESQQQANDIVENELLAWKEISDSALYSEYEDDYCIVSTKHMWMLERMFHKELVEDREKTKKIILD